MFRFTIRDMLWLTVVVAVAVTGWYAEYRRHQKNTPELSKLLSERLDAAKAEVDCRFNGYFTGRLNHIERLESLRQWAEAAVESDLSPANKVAECQKALSMAEECHQELKDKYEADVEPKVIVERAKFTVSHIQILLRAAKDEARMR